MLHVVTGSCSRINGPCAQEGMASLELQGQIDASDRENNSPGLLDG